MNLDAFTRAFFECALWSSTDNSRDDGGDPLDKRFDVEDIAEPCLSALAAECAAFQVAHAEDIATRDAERAGHDFWLTRNGHGAGFWDGDWPEPSATRLTDASKACGGVDLYVGDDGKVWAMGYEEGKRWTPRANA